MAGTVTVDGVEYEVPETLTLRESLDIEQAIGKDAGPIAMTIATVWIAMRKVKDGLTFDAVCDELDWDNIKFVTDGDGDPPTKSSNGATTTPSRTPNGTASAASGEPSTIGGAA